MWQHIAALFMLFYEKSSLLPMFILMIRLYAALDLFNLFPWKSCDFANLIYAISVRLAPRHCEA